MSEFLDDIYHEVYHLRMSSVLRRSCLWPFALRAAFPHSLGGRDSTDYYGQSAPRRPLLPKPAFPFLGKGDVVPR